MLFTFPSQYWYAIGLSVVFSLSGWSPTIQPEFLVLRPTQVSALHEPRIRLRGCHPLRPGFPAGSASIFMSFGGSYNPGTRLDAAGLGSSPFARRYSGNRSYFLFLRVLRCFSSPRSPPRFSRMWGSLPTGCPIRTSAGLCVFATRRSFSQLVTSFFASESQGIPHAPFSVPLFLYVTVKVTCGPVPSGTVPLSPFDSLDCETLCFYSSSRFDFPDLSQVSSLPACQCPLFLKWRITDSNR